MNNFFFLETDLSSCADVLQGLIKLLHYFSNTASLVFLPLLYVANGTNGKQFCSFMLVIWNQYLLCAY